jgi:hypothetical protein
MTLHELVERERRHVRRRELIAGALLGGAAAAVLLALGAVVLGGARWLSLPRVLPFVVWLLIVAAGAALARETRRRLRRDATRAQVAHAIEAEQRLRRGALLGALELEGRGPLAARAAAATRRTLPYAPTLAPALREAGHRRTLVAAGGALAAGLLLVSATPLFGDGLRAVLRPIDAWRGALLPRPAIDSAPGDLLRGAPVHLVIRAPGRERVMLSVRQTGEAWRTDTLHVGRDGVARWHLEALRGDLRLVASDGRASSDSVVIHAADRPFLGAVVLRVTYPAYLARPAETLPVGEPMRLPRGTTLEVSGRASVPLASVSLVGERNEQVVLRASGHTFGGRLVADHSARLRWLAAGTAGPVTDLPAPLELEVLPDSAPRVEIRDPAVDTVIVADDRVSLGLTASDDHGIATVAVRIARAGADADRDAVTQPVASSVGTAWVGPAAVDLAPFSLRPGDALRVRAEAVDASPWSQRGVSRDLILKRPTLDESRAGARVLGDSAAKEARAAAAAQGSLAQRTDEASRAQSRGSSAQGSQSSGQRSSGSQPAQPDRASAMSYESAEKARGLAQEQRAMAERVQRLRQATQQLEQQLKAAGALDSALARQLADAQELLRQALTPELMAQMQRLESAAREQNQDRARDALRDLARMQQRLKEQLEQSAEMLKRAAHEGAMQTLADEARELAAKERALADSGRTAPKPKASPSERGLQDARSQQASALAERAARLQSAMQNLKDRLAQDDATPGASGAAKAQEHAANSENGMRKASSAMRAGEQQQGGDQANASAGDRSGEREARDAADEMQRAAQSMQEARDAQVADWKKELTSELDRSAQEMTQLARQERALAQQARGGAQGEDRRGAQSAVEQGLDKASERLQGAGRKSALVSPRSQRAVSEARDKVAQATQSVSSSAGAGSQQADALGDAAEALTRAAASLSRDRARANASKSASGFAEMIQQMQEMAKQQGQINSRAQGLMGMPNGGGGEGQSMARSLARQQRQIADQLEDVGDAAGGERAAQLAREARQLADALDGGRLDAGTLARQQQLFRRLLDAGRTLEKEERDDSGKREATSATGDATYTPTGSVDAKAAIRFRPPTWQELRGLSADERRAILDYFTRINGAQQP